ncbi:MAG: DUF3471 domain-containing protein [Puniceicoccaceae bacterium]|nr:MAG: DUF3471 domain-containing protein [Puniceicoccaceae bacterium]
MTRTSPPSAGWLAAGLVALVWLTAASLAASPWAGLASEAGEGGLVAIEVRSDDGAFSARGLWPESEQPVSQWNVRYQVGSVTKVFTALLLALAVVEERVGLDDPIGPHLKGWVDELRDPRLADITFAQLAAHTSGLPRLPGNFMPADPVQPYRDYTVDDLAAFLRQARLAEEEPSGEYRYSNLGYGLLGHLLERIYGESLASLLRMKVFVPLRMSESGLGFPSAGPEALAPGMAGPQPAALWEFDALAGAGAAYSTVADLGRFAAVCLDPASAPGYLGPAIVSMFQPLTAFETDEVGLAWHRSPFPGGHGWWHNGATGGHSSILALFHGERRAVVALAGNSALAGNLLAVAGGVHPVPGSRDRDSEAPTLSEGQLSDYAGLYGLSADVRFDVRVNEGRLEVRYGAQDFFEVVPAGEDFFQYQVVDAAVEFVRNDAGEVTALVLHQGEARLEAPRTTEAALQRTIRDPITLEAGILRGYVGMYEMEEEFNLRVASDDEGLIIQATGQPPLRALAYEPDRFFLVEVDAEVHFSRDRSGTVTGLTLHQLGREFSAQRIVE